MENYNRRSKKCKKCNFNLYCRNKVKIAVGMDLANNDTKDFTVITPAVALRSAGITAEEAAQACNRLSMAMRLQGK